MNIQPDSTIGEIVKINYKTSQVFQANNIDYCCGGDKTISDACREVGANPAKLIKELETLVASSDPESEYINTLSLTELSDYIVKRHHAYVHGSIPGLKKNLEKICEVHGKHYSELFAIRDLFNESAGKLTMHMQKEELLVFPFIKRLESAKKVKSPAPAASFGSVSNPIGVMIAEHQVEGDRFFEISQLSNNYLLPENGCTTYEITLKQLKDFEEDLHRHIHLENNILFPKAIDLENELIHKSHKSSSQ